MTIQLVATAPRNGREIVAWSHNYAGGAWIVSWRDLPLHRDGGAWVMKKSWAGEPDIYVDVVYWMLLPHTPVKEQAV